MLGKVFWVGALAEIGGRDPGELELALHELARKELVRPARVSSMEGESEYSFWHLLVRDVAYGQIPRAERARRHRAAAAWIERKAGERVEDLAEVLAHHYLQALELAEAAGDTEQAEELAPPARRFLALAGERALGLDTAQAEARLARALELCPADDPERPELLVRWADAAFQAGRPREAAAALDEALDLLPRPRRDGGRSAGADPARPRHASHWARADRSRSPPRPSTCSSRSRPARRSSPPTRSSPRRTSSPAPTARRSPPPTVRATLAETLGLPEPARALGDRGYARAYLGDADGLAEMERALPLLIEQGAGQTSRHPPEQPRHRPLPTPGAGPLARRFRAGDRLLRAARPRRAWRRRSRPTAPACSSSSAAPRRRSSEPVRSLLPLEASGGTCRADLGARGRAGDPPRPRRGRGRVRASPTGSSRLRARTAPSDVTVEVLAAAAAARLAAGAPERRARSSPRSSRRRAHARRPTTPDSSAAMLRTALAAGDPDLAERLADGLEPRYPLREHALCAARAQLAEHAGDHAEAATLYAEAAARWQQFGNVPERAYALLGQGRCLLALGRPGRRAAAPRGGELFARWATAPRSPRPRRSSSKPPRRPPSCAPILLQALRLRP